MSELRILADRRKEAFKKINCKQICVQTPAFLRNGFPTKHTKPSTKTLELNKINDNKGQF